MGKNVLYDLAVARYCADHRISKTSYAEQVIGVTFECVRKWINGLGEPQPHNWYVIAKVHGVDRLEPEVLGFRLAGHTLVAADPAANNNEVDHMLRRDLFGMTAGVIFGADLHRSVQGLLDGPPSPRRVGQADVKGVMDARDHLVQVGDLAGAGALGGATLIRERDTSIALLRGSFAGDAVRARAHQAVAQLVRGIGWYLEDLGRHAEARRTWLTALAIARDAPAEVRPFLQLQVLSQMSAQRVNLGRHEEALELLGFMGGREWQLTPRFRSFLHARRANALAGLGNAEGARQCMAIAEEFADAEMDERDLEWNRSGYYYGAEARMHAGHALAELGFHDPVLRKKALARTEESLAGLERRHGVSRVTNMVRLAKLHAVDGDAAATAESGMSAVAAVRRLRSPRVATDMIGVRDHLVPMWSQPGIKDLAHEIDQLARTQQSRPPRPKP